MAVRLPFSVESSPPPPGSRRPLPWPPRPLRSPCTATARRLQPPCTTAVSLPSTPKLPECPPCPPCAPTHPFTVFATLCHLTRPPSVSSRFWSVLCRFVQLTGAREADFGLPRPRYMRHMPLNSLCLKALHPFLQNRRFSHGRPGAPGSGPTPSGASGTGSSAPCRNGSPGRPFR